MSGSIALHHICWFWFILGGNSAVLAFAIFSNGHTRSTSWLVLGIICITPAGIVKAIGRRRFSHLLLRYFEHHRAERDGAFVAELLTAQSVRPGDIWWLHHGRDDPCFSTCDPRRNFDEC